jgi:hypothetical protein
MYSQERWRDQGPVGGFLLGLLLVLEANLHGLMAAVLALAVL